MKLIKLSRLLELVFFAVSIFIISTTLIYFIMPRIADVRPIVKDPEMFKGNIGIVGEVYRALTKKGESASFLILGCGEHIGCMTIPVAYKGERPAVGSKIIAYGKINRAKGRSHFIESFEAYKIKLRKDDLIGKMLYSIGKAHSNISQEGIIGFRKWLYSICEICPKLKKRLIPASLFPV